MSKLMFASAAILIFGVIMPADAKCGMDLHVMNNCLGTAQKVMGGGSDILDQSQSELKKDGDAGTCSLEQVKTVITAGTRAGMDAIASARSPDQLRAACMRAALAFD